MRQNIDADGQWHITGSTSSFAGMYRQVKAQQGVKADQLDEKYRQYMSHEAPWAVERPEQSRGAFAKEGSQWKPR